MNHAAEPSTTVSKPSGRRLLRYSMRTALVLVALACSLLGWVRAERRQSELERQVGADLEDQGARVHFIGIYDSVELDHAGKPQGWWRDLAREHLGERVSSLGVSAPYELESLDGLSNLKTLSSLVLGNDTVDDLDLTRLSKLHHLTNLSLSGKAVHDVTSLAGLRKLRNLNLSSTSVSDLTPLAPLESLETLSLSGTPVGDLTPISGLTRLKRLDLTQTPMSDLSPVAGLTSLNELSIVSTRVSDLTPLAGLPRLRSLLLGGTVTDGVRCLAELKSLEELHIEITDDSPLEDIVAVLRSGQLTTLTYLGIRGNRFSDDTLVPLKLSSVEQLVLRDTSISDQSVQHIAAMSRLKLVDVRGTRVSKRGVKQLKTMSPSLHVASSR